MLAVTGNLIYRKIVFLPTPFYTFELSVGALLYPATFFITDVIAEFYGRDKARFCVRTSIVINILIALIISGMVKLEATPWSMLNNSTFDLVFGLFGLAFLGSIVAMYVSQSLDIVIYLGIRKLTGANKFLWLRNAGSTSISLLIDTSIALTLLGIFGAIPKDQVLNLIINSYSFKLLFTVCSIPFFYLVVFFIKRLMSNRPTMI